MTAGCVMRAIMPPVSQSSCQRTLPDVRVECGETGIRGDEQLFDAVEFRELQRAIAVLAFAIAPGDIAGVGFVGHDRFAVGASGIDGYEALVDERR